MKVLVVGASGATGRRLVNQLLTDGYKVKIVVRSVEALPGSWKNNELLTIVETSLLSLSNDEMQDLVLDCKAVASCLGHNPNWKGIFGHPRLLVTDATSRLCLAIIANKPGHRVKFVLMNTAGNRDSKLKEVVSFGEKLIIGLVRLLLPPHVDNEKATAYLQNHIGDHHAFIEWCAVRPDYLTDEEAVTAYEVHASPTRSAFINAGKTSRINVGHFMAALISDEKIWSEWKGQMPVIYNTV